MVTEKLCDIAAKLEITRSATAIKETAMREDENILKKWCSWDKSDEPNKHQM